MTITGVDAGFQDRGGGIIILRYTFQIQFFYFNIVYLRPPWIIVIKIIFEIILWGGRKWHGSTGNRTIWINTWAISRTYISSHVSCKVYQWNAKIYSRYFTSRDSPTVWPLCAYFFTLLQFYVPFYVKKKKIDNFMCLLEFECAKRLKVHSRAIPAPAEENKHPQRKKCSQEVSYFPNPGKVSTSIRNWQLRIPNVFINIAVCISYVPMSWGRPTLMWIQPGYKYPRTSCWNYCNRLH